TSAINPIISNTDQYITINVKVLQKLAGNRWKEYNLVFPSSIGTPINPSNLLRIYKGYLRKAGIPDAPFHYLRHHVASLMSREGAKASTVAGILGHSDASITQRTYTHFFDEDAQQITKKMGERFGFSEEKDK
ncbi:MAG: tyrosine-type recombinase/integrase, partial [Anaerolineales bacterium]